MADEQITKMDRNIWSENIPQKCATSIKNAQVLVSYTCFVHSFIPGMQICVVMDRHTKIQDGTKTGNSKTFR